MIKSIMKSDVSIVEESARLRPAKSEVFRLWCDNKKIKELTGFEPSYSLEKGLEATIEWFSKPEHLARYKAEIYNV